MASVVPAGFVALSPAEARLALVAMTRLQSTVRSSEVDELVVSLGMAVTSSERSRLSEVPSCSRVGDGPRLPVAEVGLMLGVGDRRVQQMLHDPECVLTGEQIGRTWFIDPTSVEAERERRDHR